MRGAFVVQLRETTQSGALEGTVEEVDVGQQVRFHSENELIGFLRERFAQLRNDQRKEDTNE
jgi:hypothetical protein